MPAPGRWACPGFPRGAQAMGVEEPRGASRRRRAEVRGPNGRQNHRELRSPRSRGTSLRSLPSGATTPPPERVTALTGEHQRPACLGRPTARSLTRPGVSWVSCLVTQGPLPLRPLPSREEHGASGHHAPLHAAHRDPRERRCAPLPGDCGARRASAATCWTQAVTARACFRWKPFFQ